MLGIVFVQSGCTNGEKVSANGQAGFIGKPPGCANFRKRVAGSPNPFASGQSATGQIQPVCSQDKIGPPRH